MPRGTPVDKMYRHLISSGYDETSAAKIAQARTGTSLVTGRRPRTEIRKDKHGKTKVGKYA